MTEKKESSKTAKKKTAKNELKKTVEQQTEQAVSENLEEGFENPELKEELVKKAEDLINALQLKITEQKSKGLSSSRYNFAVKLIHRIIKNQLR